MAYGESGNDLDADEIRHTPCGVFDNLTLAVEHSDRIRGFSPRLGWSHYRALCAEKNEAIARYSVLSESKKIFAAKYVKVLPTEEELKREIEREQWLIEAHRFGNEVR